MTSQCNCSMSLLKRQCPREDFKCKRCLTRQKNSGQVFQVDVDAVTNTGFFPSIPTFITKLYWDHGSSSLIPEQEDVPVSDVECRYGIWAKLDEDDNSLDFLQLRTGGLGIGSERLTQLGVFLYYFTQWRLILRYDLVVKGTGILGEPGYIHGYDTLAVAFYTSGENDCFFNDPHGFIYQSQTSSLTFEDEGGTDPSVTLPTFTFPSSVSFQTVANDGFNA